MKKCNLDFFTFIKEGWKSWTVKEYRQSEPNFMSFDSSPFYLAWAKKMKTHRIWVMKGEMKGNKKNGPYSISFFSFLFGYSHCLCIFVFFMTVLFRRFFHSSVFSILFPSSSFLFSISFLVSKNLPAHSWMDQ